MKNILRTLCLALMPFVFASCFEITEEVTMHEDGSGKVRLTINLSESRESLVNYMKMEEVEGMRVPSRRQIDADLDRVDQILRSMQGMSKVEIQRDFERFVFIFSGEFTDVKVLNQAINTVAEVLNRTDHPTINTDNFQLSNNEFQRFFKYPFPEKVYDQASLSQRYLMDTARMISIFRFPRPVRQMTNKKAMISPSKKSVMLQASIAQLAKKEVLLDNKISF